MEEVVVVAKMLRKHLQKPQHFYDGNVQVQNFALEYLLDQLDESPLEENLMIKNWLDHNLQQQDQEN